MKTLIHYLSALVCPPLALAFTGRKISACVSGVLYLAALATIDRGYGAILLAFLIVWACRVSGEHRARKEVVAFVKNMNARPVEKLRRINHAA